MSSIGERIRELRLKEKLTQQQLADKLNCSHQSISCYENDRNLNKIKDFIQLCKYFNEDIYYLITGSKKNNGKEITSEEQQILSSYHKLSKSDRRVVDFILGIGEYDIFKTIEKHSKIYLLPVYEQDVAAGPGQLGFDQKHTMEEFHENDMPKKVSYGIHIKGSSMETKDENNIPDKSTVLVSTEFDYDDLIGEAVIANIGGVLVCKEYNIAEDGHLWLKSRNPNKSEEDRHIYDIDGVKIIGRVVKVINL